MEAPGPQVTRHVLRWAYHERASGRIATLVDLPLSPDTFQLSEASGSVSVVHYTRILTFDVIDVYLYFVHQVMEEDPRSDRNSRRR